MKPHELSFLLELNKQKFPGSSEVIQGELARISAKLNLKASPSREGT